jgi:hypothetical protein
MRLNCVRARPRWPNSTLLSALEHLKARIGSPSRIRTRVRGLPDELLDLLKGLSAEVLEDLERGRSAAAVRLLRLLSGGRR